MTKRILFIGHDLKFIIDFINYLKYDHLKYEVRAISYKGHKLKVKYKKQNFDIIFCEWALDNAVFFSNNKPLVSKLIVRLHSQELRLFKKKFLDKINWKNVDALIVISPKIKEDLLKYYPFLINIIIYIPNYVHEKKISIDNKKFDKNFKIGMLGFVPALKRIDLAFSLISRLRNYDNRYKLFIKGKHPNDYIWMRNRVGQLDWYSKVFEKFSELIDKKIIIFEDADEDVASWYEKIGIILSMSDVEGSHQVVAEGILSGCVPIIRNWDGAMSIYGNPVFEDMDEMLSYIMSFQNKEYFSEISNRYKEFASSNFSFEKVSHLLLKVIDSQV